MANFRSFTLYSADRNESVDLNSFNGYLVTAPSGLGIYLSNKYLNLGNKRLLTDQKNEFNTIAMTIDIFGQTRNAIEQKYCALRDFLARNRADGFILSYLPYEGGQERYIECDIKAFDKSEKATNRYMAIPLTVEPKSFWKVDVQTFAKSNVTTREFEFAEDANITNDIIISNASGQYNGSQSDIIITPSSGTYDKTELPDGIKINVHCYEAYIHDISFDKSDFKLISETVYRAEMNRIDDANMKYDTTFFCEFNVGSETFSAGVCFYDYDQTILTENVDYTKNAYGGRNKRYVIEFDDSFIDKTCRVEGDYVEEYYDVRHYSIAKQKGQKVVFFNAPAESFSITSVKMIARRSIQYNDYHGRQIPPSYYWWDMNAEISKGKDNYFAPLLEDAGIVGGDYYCIPFGIGKSSAASILNDGDTEVPALLRINGEATNPTVILSRKSDGVTVQSTAINLTIPENRYVEIDSDPANTGAWLKGNPSVTPNVVGLLDIRTSMFITIPRGEFYIRAYDSTENPVRFSVSFGKEYFGA